VSPTAGNTIDFKLSEKRDKAAANAFFIKAIGSMGCQRKSLSINAVQIKRD
jgi:transposase-like protein